MEAGSNQKKMPQIAIFIPTMSGGGAERAMLNLSRGMVERGLQVDLVLSRAEGPYLSEVHPKVRVVNLAAPRVLRSFMPLVRYLYQERPRAMISALDHANVVALWANRFSRVKVKTVVCVQDNVSTNARNSSKARFRLMPLWIRLFYPWADAIVTVSEGVADDLAQTGRLRRKGIRVVHNPVVIPKLFAKASEPVKHPWFKANEPPVVLSAGRLTLQKDQVTLLRAFKRVREQRRTRLMILGEGEARLQLEDLIRRLGLVKDVALPGFIENPFAYMSRSSVFVLSSIWEGLPTVLIEALALGIPVVSTDCPSGPMEILAGGKYGRLVPMRDVEALAEATLSVLAQVDPVVPVESWKPYTLDVVVTRYLRLLEEALA